MLWQPQNLAETCSNSYNFYQPITSCQPSTFVFLQLVTNLLGTSTRQANNQGNDQFGRDEFSNIFGSKTDNFWSSAEDSQAVSEYDFIVVGAGSAGCVVANRLSEIHEWKVLLIEAGMEEPKVADVPAFAPTIRQSSIDWAYRTQPQKTNCRARRNGQCTWARGKVMGGSSVLNYMIYFRGHRIDYDEWSLLGNPGWSFREVFPYFLKSEENGNVYHSHNKYQIPVSPEVHGINGELNVEYFPYQDANVFYSLEAWRELGLPLFDQNIMTKQIGASLSQHTTKDGIRESTNLAFIEPIRDKRPNLRVLSKTLVTRVLINPHTKKAFGIEYIRNGHLVQALARKEVILSAGAINSPKLLMVSGIGPGQHLSSLNIPVIKELEGVGRNLHDHSTVDGIILALNNYTATTAQPEQIQQDIYSFIQTHRGPLSAPGPLQVNAFIQTQFEHDYERADIQVSLDAVNIQDFYSDPILTQEANVLPSSYYNGIHIRPVLLYPKSRGFILLNSSDPILGDPLIYPNTYSDQQDVARMVEAMRICVRFGNTRVMQKIGAQIVTQELQYCSQYSYGTDEYFACLLQSYTATIYHPVGTCKMGPKADAYSVVDHELIVHGISNLRVIDASIMPIIPRGNTNAPVIMIGEKGSDLIKSRWLKKGSVEDHFDVNF